MERVSFDIERKDIAEALHAEAAAQGRSIEAEVALLVERTYAPKARRNGNGETSIETLRRLGRGLEIEVTSRTAEPYEPPKLW